MKIDVGDRDIHLPLNKLKLPTETKSMLLAVKVKRKCKAFHIAPVKKIQKISNQLFSIRNVHCLFRYNMLSQKVSFISKLEKLCDTSFQFKHISGTVCDNARLEFDAFLSTNVLRDWDIFQLSKKQIRLSFGTFLA